MPRDEEAPLSDSVRERFRAQSKGSAKVEPHTEAPHDPDTVYIPKRNGGFWRIPRNQDSGPS